MQGLGRFAQHPEYEDSSRPPSSGSALIADHGMYQPIPTSEHTDGSSSPQPRCLSTRGSCFNFVVGAVVCANAVLLAVEADLGLLGPAAPAWTGLETDLLSVDIHNDALKVGLEKSVKNEIKDGITADQRLKANLQKKLNATLHHNVPLNGELALPMGSGKLKFAAYTVCEYFFVLFFLFEAWIRMCDLGCREYFCRYPWMLLDMVVVTTGLADVSLPFFLDAEMERQSVLPFLRLLRVLRLLKIFQVCQPLRIIGRAVVKAFGVVVLVGLVVGVLNFGLAIILTTLVGQRATPWAVDETEEDIETWFGSIGRSMQTLFTIQTLSGWDHIAAVLSGVYPSTVVVPLIIIYMMLCCFAVIGLITSVISDSFMASQQKEQKNQEVGKALRYENVTRHLEEWFFQYGRSLPGCIGREELEKALSEPQVSSLLLSMERPAKKTEILKLYDRINKEPSFSGRVQAGHMAEAVVTLSSEAKVIGLFDVKHKILGVRNEVIQKAEVSAKDSASQRKELKEIHELARSSQALVKEVQKDVATVRDDVTVMKAQIGKVLVKLEEHAKNQEQDRQDRNRAMAELNDKVNALVTQSAVVPAMSGKVDAIASQIAAQSGLGGKLDALAVRISTQTVVSAKVEALLGQVSAQLVSLNSDKGSDEKWHLKELEAQADTKASEPAAEPESPMLEGLGQEAVLPSPEELAAAQAASPAAGPPEDSQEPWAAAFPEPRRDADTQDWAVFPSGGQQ